MGYKLRWDGWEFGCGSLLAEAVGEDGAGHVFIFLGTEGLAGFQALGTANPP